MKKIILALSLSLIGFSSLAENAPKQDKKEDTLTLKEQELIKDNINASYKLLAIEHLCAKSVDKITHVYAHSLIYSSAFVNPKIMQMGFAKKLEAKTLNSLTELKAQGETCVLQNPADLNSFRQDINSRVVNSFYNLFSNEKTLQSDIKKNSNKSIYDMLEERFFDTKYEIIPKNKGDDKEALMNSYVNAVAGYKNLTSCYKSLHMTNDQYNKAKKNLGPLLINTINASELPTIEKMTLVTTGFILADTLHKDSCDNTKIALDLFNKLQVIKK